MFTGIIETLGTVVAIEKDQSNVHFTVESTITHELKIDQSVAHNGCCLTVVKLDGDSYVVTAIPVSYTHLDVYKRQVWKKAPR